MHVYIYVVSKFFFFFHFYCDSKRIRENVILSIHKHMFVYTVQTPLNTKPSTR